MGSSGVRPPNIGRNHVSIPRDIYEGVSSTIDFLTVSGVNIYQSLVANNTVNVITATAARIAGVFEFVGDGPDFILFVLDRLIVVPLVIFHLWLRMDPPHHNFPGDVDPE